MYGGEGQSKTVDEKITGTPMSKTNLMLKKAGLGLDPTKSIHKRLLFGNAVIEEP